MLLQAYCAYNIMPSDEEMLIVRPDLSMAVDKRAYGRTVRSQLCTDIWFKGLTKVSVTVTVTV